MKTRIFFMSGTGNSLWIAKCLALELGGDVELTGLQSVKEKITIDADRIGFVVPVYFSDLPELVKKVVRLLTFQNTSYIFGIVTYGAIIGNALSHLKTEIEDRGTTFGAGYSIVMPDNSIAFRTSEKKKSAIFGRCESEVQGIARQIAQGFTNGSNLREKKLNAVAGAITRLGLLDIFGARKKHSTSGCTKCGLCTQFCPVQNITIENGVLKFADKCAQCFGCAHWCKNHAIRYGRLVISDKTRYTHPKVTSKDLMHYNT